MRDNKRPLSDAEIRRLERLERTRANKRGRKNPAAVPARLARTSAFAPKRRNLITDSKFRRTYIVPGHSYIEVAGRELGSPPAYGSSRHRFAGRGLQGGEGWTRTLGRAWTRRSAPTTLAQAGPRPSADGGCRRAASRRPCCGCCGARIWNCWRASSG